MKYIRLKENCILVEGAVRSALYDLSEGKVYSINRSAHRVLTTSMKKGVKGRHRRFINELITLGLVETSDTPFASQEEPKIIEKPNEKLQFVWLEVTSKCNLSCLHCYGECHSTPVPDKLDEEAWKTILVKARNLGCSQVQFIGGEPLLRKDLFKLVDFAIAQGYIFVEIFTNLTLLKEENISFLRGKGVNIATTLYSFNPHTHDLITGAEGSHSKTVKAINRLKENDISVRVAVIAMRQNQHELFKTVDFLQRMGVDYKMPDPVRPTGRGCSREIQPLNLPPEFSGQMTEARFWTDEYSFYFNKRFNSCWGGKVAITATGEVIPCIFARDLVVGNVLEKELEDIMQEEKLRKLWGLSKDQVEVCRDCEYRYACHDCRPLAYAQGGNLYAKPPRCLYDPYRGVWKNE